jgi:hypothetical protein
MFKGALKLIYIIIPPVSWASFFALNFIDLRGDCGT